MMYHAPNIGQSLVILVMSFGFAILVTLILRTFAPEWCVENRNLMPIIIGSVILAPWLVVMARMRKSA